MEEKKLSRLEFETSVVMKAWNDEAFLNALRENPKDAIQKEFGQKIPEDMVVKILEEDEATMYIVIPHFTARDKNDLTDEELMKIAGGVGRINLESTLSNLTFSKDDIY